MDKEHWETVAKGRNAESYASADTMNAVRLQLTLDILNKYQPGKLLDAGCGGGATTTAVIEQGWDVEAIDYAENMVDETNSLLQKKGIMDIQAKMASVTDLSLFRDEEFDAIICLGVMYYIKDDDRAYREFLRILKPGGILICSMQNEFFDLTTFNSYTRRFFKKHFFPLIDGGTDKRAEELDSAIRSLITNPDSPIKHDSGSARDSVFTRQDNPLAYPNKLGKHGFKQLSGPYYHGIHLMPPLIEKNNPSIANESRKKQYELAQDWRSMFTAAHFLFEFSKNG